MTMHIKLDMPNQHDHITVDNVGVCDVTLVDRDRCRYEVAANGATIGHVIHRRSHGRFQLVSKVMQLLEEQK